MPGIDSINHVGMAVRDLRATAARYEAMGFLLTPFSPHSGAWQPGQAPQPLHSGNRCVMFDGDYLEILGTEDPARPAERITRFLAHHEGAHILCFNSEDVAGVDRRLRAAGVATSGVIPLQREIDTPDGVRTAKFERVQFAPDDSPEGYIQAARHLTPQYIYQPRYIAHPNGCRGLSGVYLLTGDVAAFAARYARYTGLAAPQPAGDVASFRLPRGARLTLLSPMAALQRLPGTLHPPLPGIVAVGFACPDLDAQARRLAEARVPFTRTPSRIVVPAEAASGVAIAFEASD